MQSLLFRAMFNRCKELTLLLAENVNDTGSCFPSSSKYYIIKVIHVHVKQFLNSEEMFTKIHFPHLRITYQQDTDLLRVRDFMASIAACLRSGFEERSKLVSFERQPRPRWEESLVMWSSFKLQPDMLREDTSLEPPFHGAPKVICQNI